MKEKFSLKDQLFNPVKIGLLSASLQNVYPDFERHLFENEIIEQLPQLELKARIKTISKSLQKYLPQDYKTAVHILINALPEALDESKTDNDFGDFIYAPFAEFIATFGCNAEHLFFSLNALKEITKRFSAEFSIRAFINKFPQETLIVIEDWASDKNYHVRRLSSEGTRPKLPWAEKINISYDSTLSILQKLYHDKTRYVTRSVANHLNDISKINPEMVLSVLKNWEEKGNQESKEFEFIKNHSLRTLIKSGFAPALAYLGYTPDISLNIKKLGFEKTLKIGDSLYFSFELEVESDFDAVIDYIVHFQNKSGKMNSKKVFKLKKQKLISKSVNVISKKHQFKADMSTKKLYPGQHKIEIQINGKIIDGFEFELSD
jgi:3-methyladenine DNA glycosylase AlkC